jgi:hypothetical protein
VRWRAAGAVGKVFGQVLDKDLAWKDLQSLTMTEIAMCNGELQAL